MLHNDIDECRYCGVEYAGNIARDSSIGKPVEMGYAEVEEASARMVESK